VVLKKWSAQYGAILYSYTFDRETMRGTYKPESFSAEIKEKNGMKFKWGPGMLTLDKNDADSVLSWLMAHKYQGRAPDKLASQAEASDYLEQEIMN
jgi:hypothetical protein